MTTIFAVSRPSSTIEHGFAFGVVDTAKRSHWFAAVDGLVLTRGCFIGEVEATDRPAGSDVRRKRAFEPRSSINHD
jgi:hypothetical protein